MVLPPYPHRPPQRATNKKKPRKKKKINSAFSVAQPLRKERYIKYNNGWSAGERRRTDRREEKRGGGDVFESEEKRTSLIGRMTDGRRERRRENPRAERIVTLYTPE